MRAFEDAPADLDTWDANHLRLLVWWTSRGVRFSSRNGENGNVGSIWTTANLTAVLDALGRSGVLLGEKMMAGLGLENGNLTFNKWRGTAPGGFYHSATNTIDLNLADHFLPEFGGMEAAVEAVIHEIGHAVDNHAMQSGASVTYFSERTAWTNLGWKLEQRGADPVWALSAQGIRGAPTRYALSVSPVEDFAETFTFAVLGGPRQFAPGGLNPENAFGNAPSPTRLRLLQAAISVLQ